MGDCKLKVLMQQAEKALNKRISEFLGKHEYKEREAKKAKGRAIKKRMRQQTNINKGK